MIRYAIILLSYCLSTVYIAAQSNISMGNSSATGDNSFAAGDSSMAIGATTVAIGNKARAIGDFSISLGDQSTAMGKWSQAYGFGSFAEGDYSLASGFFNRAWTFGVAIGAANYAATDGAIAMGRDNIASGSSSTAIGTWSRARSYGETVLGAYSEDYTPSLNGVFQWDPTDRLFVIANGRGDGAGNGIYSNALTMLKNGDTQLNGKLSIGQGLTLPTIGARPGEYLRANDRGDLIWASDCQDVSYAGASYPLKMIPQETIIDLLDTIEIVGGGQIIDATDIKVCIDLKHEDLEEVKIFLSSPNGTGILLVETLIGGNMNNTCFTSQSTTDIFAHDAPYTGDYAPGTSFNDLIGDNINGLWIMEIEDIGGTAPEGILNAWTLTIANNKGAVESSGSDGFGFIADSNASSGYRAADNTLDGFYAESNDENGYRAVSNDNDGYYAELNNRYGFQAKNNLLGGYYAELNSDHGYIAKDNTKSGYFSESNDENGFYGFGNNENGFLAEDNAVGFKAIGTGFGFEASTFSVGFKYTGTAAGFEANTSDVGYKSTGTGIGFEATTPTTGYQYTGPGTAFKAISAVNGFESNASLVNYSSTGGNTGFISTGALNGFESNATLFNYSSTGGATGFKSTGDQIAFESTGSVFGLRTTANSIGVISTAVNAGQFNGDLHYTGQLVGPSDGRLKIIMKSSKAPMLEKIKSLSLHSYVYKTDQFKNLNLPKVKQYGVIAQELEKVFPELVSTITIPAFNEDGTISDDSFEYLGVNHIGLIPILTKGVQELAEENEVLRKENAEIKERLARIETLLLELKK